MLLTHVRVPAADAELASDALWAAGATAVEERANSDGTVTLISDAVAAGPWPVEIIPVTDDGWDAWCPWARAWRAAPQSRLVVQPPWVEPVADSRSDDLVLGIDPGRAFGSGSHPTTRLVLTEIERRVTQGSSMLDVGCGSGVLAIAAARLGAEHVVAVDVDPDALRATAANAVRNGVADRLAVSTRPIHDLDERFDLVVANVSTSTIIWLAAALADRVSPNGALVLSGVLAHDRDRVLAAFSDWQLGTERSAEGWLLIALTRYRSGASA